ncbi:MAG: radical SAM protein [Lachnospiraceae bacterium]|nr:radical SAM protein [Lachnospiraceae bacterium]
MFYRVNENIAPRSWMFVPGAYYVKNEIPAKRFTDEELDIVLLCDGEHDIEDSAVVTDLLNRGIIEKCHQGDHPSAWSTFRSYPHRYFHAMNFMITGKCNYNCIHCFNAADNAPLMSQWSLPEALDLLDQAADCGIQAFTITGGEPMLHPHFMDIIRGIHERNMFVEEINTNGHFITAELLRELNDMGADPVMKISFDGIGCHDWIRNRQGAESDAKEAIRLCRQAGFSVMVQMQVNRRSIDTILPTAKLINELGVFRLRMIRTTEVARWREAAGDACLTIDEYYDRMPRVAREIYDYISSLPEEERHLSELMIWQLLTVDLENDSYNINPVRFAAGEYRDTAPVCEGNRVMVGVSADGSVTPCLMFSGYLLEHGIKLGNVHETPLAELLSGGMYHDMITKNVYQLRQLSEKCRDCRHFSYCAGGCRALALLYSKDERGFWDEDPVKCRFFNEGWYEHTKECLGNMKDMKPLSF